MVWKYINIGNAGTASLFGSDDMDKISKLLRGDLNVDTVDINSVWKFRDNKLQLSDVSNNNKLTIRVPELTADSDYTYPALTTGDIGVTQAFAQTLTNKTIDAKNNTLGDRNYTTKVFKDGSTYYAVSYDGTLLDSGSVFEDVFQSALDDDDGVIYLSNSGQSPFTEYNCSGSFTGFTLGSGNIIVGDGPSRVFISVPNGFTGTCINSKSIGISGIGLSEQGTPARNWKAIKLTCGSGEDVSFAIIKDLQIYNPGTGIELETTHSSAFINSNMFQNIIVWSPDDVGYQFTQTAGDIDENVFINTSVQCRSGSPQTHGFKDIDGSSNIFFGCKVWDPADAIIESNIKSTADGVQIISCRMTGGKGHFIDQGTKTLILDSGNIVTTRVMTTPDLAKIGFYSGASSLTNATGIMTGRVQIVTTGTGGSSATCDSSGVYRTLSTGATNNSLSGQYNDSSFGSRINNAYFKSAIQLNNNTNMRVFAGLINSTSAPASSSDPLNALEGIGLWLDTAVSANWKIMHNDSSGASTVDDTSVAAATGTLYPVEIYALADTKFRFVFNGTSTDISTNIPASTTILGFRVYLENTTGSDRVMRYYYTILKTDK